MVFSGTVVGEEHHERFVKLLINIERALINNKAVEYRIPVEFYSYRRNAFLGRKISIKGRIRNSKYPNQSNILVGDIVATDMKNGRLWQVLYLVRNYIDSMLRSLLKTEHHDLGVGLILGGSGRIQEDLKNVFSRAGVLHILAVSGLHVGFVCVFAGFILFFIPVSTKIKFSIIMLILCLYAGVTGFRPSVCRATLMAFFFGLGILFQRNVEGVHIINITAIILLVISPLLIYNVAAQLSFAAVYGIFLLYPKLHSSIIKKMKGKLCKYIMVPMAVSFSAQLFVSPLLIYYFNRLPTLAVISNLIIVPIASLTIFMLFGCLMIGTFSFLFAQVISVCVSILLSLLIIISTIFANLPFSTITVYISPIFLLLLYFLCAQRLRRIVLYSIVVIAFLFSISSYSDCIIMSATPSGTLISTPDGETIFATLQQSSARCTAFLANQNMGKLDYLIAPENFYTTEKEFFQTPLPLHSKRLKFGEVIIDVAKKMSVLFRGQIVLYDSGNLDVSKDMVQYIISNGKEMEMFSTPQYGSIIDQIMVDLRVTFVRLKYLLQ